jgi:hypothetical protein
MRDLERRVRKLESTLPPLLTPEVSWIFGLLWFAVAYYFGDPSPDEEPFAGYVRALGYANESELNNAMVHNYRDLSNRAYSAEDKICAKFGIHIPSLENCDSEKLFEALKRMEAGLPRSYKDQLKTLLTRVDDLGWIRVHSDNVSDCFRVNPAYLRERIRTGSGLDWRVEARDENGGGPGVRLRKRHQKKS